MRRDGRRGSACLYLVARFRFWSWSPARELVSTIEQRWDDERDGDNNQAARKRVRSPADEGPEFDRCGDISVESLLLRGML